MSWIQEMTSNITIPNKKMMKLLAYHPLILTFLITFQSFELQAYCKKAMTHLHWDYYQHQVMIHQDQVFIRNLISERNYRKVPSLHHIRRILLWKSRKLRKTLLLNKLKNQSKYKTFLQNNNNCTDIRRLRHQYNKSI